MNEQTDASIECPIDIKGYLELLDHERLIERYGSACDIMSHLRHGHRTGSFPVIKPHVYAGTRIVAYGANPGHGVIIWRTLRGQCVAATTEFLAYPDRTQNAEFRWNEQLVGRTLQMIKNNDWLHRYVHPTVKFTYMLDGWKLLHTTTLKTTKSYLYAAAYGPTDLNRTLDIIEIKSGRIRIHVDERHVPIEEMASWVMMVEKLNHPGKLVVQDVKKLPLYNNMEHVISMGRIPEELANAIKVAAIQQKMGATNSKKREEKK